LALGAAACGGRFAQPAAITGTVAPPGHVHSDAAAGNQSAGTTGSTSTTLSAGARQSNPSSAGPSSSTLPLSGPTEDAITSTYESYLHQLSGLDDTLSKAYIGPLATVTTTRLAQASVRQAAALLGAQEHAVGSLRDDHLSVTLTGPSSAALADCQDQEHFYLVNDSGAPDSFIGRGYFVGSAQLVLQEGHWLVDTFTTTHVPCPF
jgi:hypothetical protein